MLKLEGLIAITWWLVMLSFGFSVIRGNLQRLVFSSCCKVIWPQITLAEAPDLKDAPDLIFYYFFSKLPSCRNTEKSTYAVLAPLNTKPGLNFVRSSRISNTSYEEVTECMASYGAR